MVKNASLNTPPPHRPDQPVGARTLAGRLRGHPLTLLCGPPGDTRSNALRDGVMPLLQRRASDSPIAFDTGGAVVLPFPDRRGAARPGSGLTTGTAAIEVAVLLDNWLGQPVDELHTQIARLLCIAPLRVAAAGPTLATRLQALAERFDVRFLLVCDRFEDALRAAEADGGCRVFIDELSAVIRAARPAAHVLLSVGDDVTALLSGFRQRFPALDSEPLWLSTGVDDEQPAGPAPVRPPARSPQAPEPQRPSIRLVTPAAGTPPRSASGAPPADAAAPAPGRLPDREWTSSIESILARIASTATRPAAVPTADTALAFGEDDPPTRPFVADAQSALDAAGREVDLPLEFDTPPAAAALLSGAAGGAAPAPALAAAAAAAEAPDQTAPTAAMPVRPEAAAPLEAEPELDSSSGRLPQAEAAPGAEPESGPASTRRTETETELGPRPGSGPAPRPGPALQTEPEPEPDSRLEPAPVPQPESGSRLEPALHSQPRSDTEPEPAARLEPLPGPEPAPTPAPSSTQPATPPKPPPPWPEAEPALARSHTASVAPAESTPAPAARQTVETPPRATAVERMPALPAADTALHAEPAGIAHAAAPALHDHGGSRRAWAAAAVVLASAATWWWWPAGDRSGSSGRPLAILTPTRPVAPPAASPPAAPAPVARDSAAAPPVAAPNAVVTPPSTPTVVAALPSLGLAVDGDDGGAARLAGDLARWVGSPAGIGLKVEPAAGWADALAAPRDGQRLAVARYDALAAMKRESPGAAIRLVTPLVSEELYFIARADSPLGHVHDIERATRINVGPAQGGRAVTAQTVYQRLFDHPMLAGQASFANRDAALHELLATRGIDVIVVVDAQPSAWLARLPAAQLAAIKLLPLAPDHPTTLRARRTYLPAVLHAGASPVQRETPTLSVMSFLVATGDPATASGAAAPDAGRGATSVRAAATASTSPVAALASGLCRQLDALRRNGHPKWQELQPGLQLPAGWPYAGEAVAAFRNCTAVAASTTATMRAPADGPADVGVDPPAPPAAAGRGPSGSSTDGSPTKSSTKSSTRSGTNPNRGATT